MRLRKEQKEKLLEWITEGLHTDEINLRASQICNLFNVSRQQVDYYRKSRSKTIKILVAIDEEGALSAGLALKSERVNKLKQLAALMEEDLFGGFLWVEDCKGVGAGASAEVVDFDRFNSAEVDQYRGTLDDIAKEMGERNQKVEIDGRLELLWDWELPKDANL